MTKTRFRYSVVLTDEAAQLLSKDFSDILQLGRVLNCDMVDPDGQYLSLTLQQKRHKLLGGSFDNLGLLIPHHYVLYVMSYPPNKEPGFHP